MCKHKLSQLQSLQEEIKDIEKRIEKVREKKDLFVADTVKDYRSGHPRTIIIRGCDENACMRRDKLIDRQEKLLLKRRLESIELATDILEWIHDIENAEIRRIMTHRYIDGLTWQQIAKKMKEADESYPRRKHDKFLKLAENAERKVI